MSEIKISPGSWVSLISYIKHYLLDLDWTKSPCIFILVSLFILSRIPLLNLGFGADADAWRIANSAFDLKHHQIYHTSRFPGYPFPEYFNSLIIDYGWLATNSMTMILSLISVIFFAKILKDFNVKNKGLLVLTYAFLPILWINSANTMDYMWALTFIILVWFFVLKNRYVFAGLAMGLAIGSRITSVILIVPFIYLIWMAEKRKFKDIICFILVTIIISSILFLPLFLQHGLKFLTFYSGKVNLIERGYRIAEYFGVFPTFFGVALFMLSLKVLFKGIMKKDKDIIFLLSVILLIGIWFINAPYDVEYLIPAVPFSVLLMNKIISRKLVVILCILLLLNSFVSFFIVERDDDGKLILHTLHDGIIKKNIEWRTKQIDSIERLMNIDINHSVVIVGWYISFISYLGTKASFNKDYKMIEDEKGVWNFEKDIRYRNIMPLDELQDFQEKGYTVYYIKQMRGYTERVYGYDLNEYDCVPLDIEFW